MDEELITCSICLYPVYQNEYINTQCGHKFCLGCFMAHITFNNRMLNNSACPLCRHSLQYNRRLPPNKKKCKLPCGHMLSYKSFCRTIDPSKSFNRYKCCFCRQHYYFTYHKHETSEHDNIYMGNDNIYTGNIYAYAMTYNMLRLMSGMAGLSFSS